MSGGAEHAGGTVITLRVLAEVIQEKVREIEASFLGRKIFHST